MAKIDFTANEDTLFTRVFYAVQQAKTRYVVVYGGASSSKSYSVHQHELLQLLEPGREDTLVIRKYSANLRESCYKLFKRLISEYELSPAFESAYSNDNKHITCKTTGRKLVFRGIDDPEKLKSIVAVKRILVEEASQLEFTDFMELDRRARGMEGIQIIMLLNPVSENHWIKTKLCDEGSPYAAETTVLRFTYRDNCNRQGNKFLTEHDVRALERLKEVDENHYRIYVLGEWGVDNTEGKFCWAFSREQIKPTAYEEGRILWATFDFNVNPLTCTIAQVFPETDPPTIRAIECIKLPNSDIWKMCARLKASYPDAIWHVTGDASGQNRSAIARDNLNYYRIIMEQLGINSHMVKVAASNPPVEENQVMLNTLHKTWNVEIDPVRCQPLIYDLTYVEVGGNGAIIKNRNSTKKYADFLDNWRYLVNVVTME